MTPVRSAVSPGWNNVPLRAMIVLMLSQEETRICKKRQNKIDPGRIAELHYLGNYTRKLPTNMARMMENAHDWEHLPYVHSSSFKSIELIDSGPWGWRAKVELPEEAGSQLIDLLIDERRHYWATTAITGVGEGIEIHTQAKALSDDDIEVDIRFYAPQGKFPPEHSKAVLGALSDQYRQLYDEDLALMEGRQSALDFRKSSQSAPRLIELEIGETDTLESAGMTIVDFREQRVCVRKWRGQWIAHNAVCPHLLGPLSDSAIDENGEITCPWHGYRFDVVSGDSLDGKCRGLEPVPDVQERDGKLFLIGSNKK